MRLPNPSTTERGAPWRRLWVLALLASLTATSACEPYGWFDRIRLESRYERRLPADPVARARLMQRDSDEVRRLVRLHKAQLLAADVFAYRDSILCEMTRLNRLYTLTASTRWMSLWELLAFQTRAEIAASRRVGTKFAERGFLDAGPSDSACAMMLRTAWDDSLPTHPDTSLTGRLFPGEEPPSVP